MLKRPDLKRVSDRLHKKYVADCEKCNGTGWRHVPLPGSDWETKMAACSCKTELVFQYGLVAGNIPREYWQADEFNWEYNLAHLKTIETYCDDLPKARKHGYGFTLVGENGTGKTSMACLTLIRALEAGYSAAYLTAHDYLTSLSRSWGEEDIKEWLLDLTGCDFLVLDELGKEYKSKKDAQMAEIDSLLRERRQAMRPTFVITNLSALQLREVYGESVSSILVDKNKTLIYEPGDYRRHKRKHGKV